MNAKAVLTFTFLVLFGKYAVIRENIVELVKHNLKITPTWGFRIFYFKNTDTLCDISLSKKHKQKLIQFMYFDFKRNKTIGISICFNIGYRIGDIVD